MSVYIFEVEFAVYVCTVWLGCFSLVCRSQILIMINNTRYPSLEMQWFLKTVLDALVSTTVLGEHIFC